MKHVFIINPKAGIKDSTNAIKTQIASVLDANSYIIYVTKKRGDAESFASKILQDNPDEVIRFYSCGGDGTLNEVVNGAVGFNNAEVTCYPSGSGNDFLKYFSNEGNFLDFRQLVDGVAINCDIVKVNDRYALNIFNIGFDANVVVKQARLKKIPLVNGKMAYNLGVVGAVLGRITANFKITVDGKEMYSDKGVLCAVANAICYGGGYYCAPKALIDDNILDIVVIKKVSRLKFAKLVSGYKDGSYVESEKHAPYIIYQKGQKIKIEANRVLNYSIDGEIYRSSVVDIDVVPQAIRFVVPQNCIKQ